MHEAAANQRCCISGQPLVSLHPQPELQQLQDKFHNLPAGSVHASLRSQLEMCHMCNGGQHCAAIDQGRASVDGQVGRRAGGLLQEGPGQRRPCRCSCSTWPLQLDFTHPPSAHFPWRATQATQDPSPSVTHCHRLLPRRNLHRRPQARPKQPSQDTLASPQNRSMTSPPKHHPSSAQSYSLPWQLKLAASIAAVRLSM